MENNKPNNPAAFPSMELNRAMTNLNERAIYDLKNEGMALRDYFAAKAMNGILANTWSKASGESDNLLAKAAYQIADAMLAQREKSTNP